MKAYLGLLRSRPAYRALWAAEVVSITGDWFSLVAVSILAARSSTTPSALALATVLAAHMLPQALFSPAAGWLADRFDRRSILIGGNLIEGALTIGMALAASAGSLALLQALLFLRSATATLRGPASGASLPSLVEPSEVATANAFGAATWSATFVVGMALGGLATELGPVTALVIDAGTFGVASLILRRLPSLPRAERR